MCWRERFLPLRSSLITYTGKEFVYVIIFSLTASLKAATIQALPASPPALRRAPRRNEPPRRAQGRVLCSYHRPTPAPHQAQQHSRALVRALRAENVSASLSCKPPSSGFASHPPVGSSPEPPRARPGSQDPRQHPAPSGTCPAPAAGVKPGRNPALGAAPPSRRATAHEASRLQGSFSNAEGKGLIQSETPRKRRPFVL